MENQFKGTNMIFVASFELIDEQHGIVEIYDKNGHWQATHTVHDSKPKEAGFAWAEHYAELHDGQLEAFDSI